MTKLNDIYAPHPDGGFLLPLGILGSGKKFVVHTPNGMRVCTSKDGHPSTVKPLRAMVHGANVVPALVVAMREIARDIAKPSETLHCHLGICSVDECSRCQRAKKFYDAIEMAEEVQDL